MKVYHFLHTCAASSHQEQTLVNSCTSNPCGSQGICSQTTNGFVCTSLPGYTGTNCQNDTNECASNPCINGGTCTELVNGYRCTYLCGYTDSMCQTRVNQCSSVPCLNGGVCFPSVNNVCDYACVCPAQYTGKNCQTVLNPCQINPCINNGQCIPTSTSSYVCLCPAGFQNFVKNAYGQKKLNFRGKKMISTNFICLMILIKKNLGKIDKNLVQRALRNRIILKKNTIFILLQNSKNI
ncbi:neurogenic locus notch-like protein [Brachionus plicatilis]|uniref:Neurogenic locus notch-like protein n=1 Tax=Brachionus plicatilis TaxID=10195 RepID=A0A3M7SK30_BRAPC|nr:neurogenic locus notch-like protein [Brachionus plicatilis]